MVAACPFPSPQGSQVLVRQLCQQLVRRGHRVDLLTYGQGRRVEDEGYEHHRIRRLPGDDASRSGPTPAKPMLDAMMVVALGRLLRAGANVPYDVVHCHNYEAAMIGLAARTRHRVPVVYHSHNLMGDELPTYFRADPVRRAAGRLGIFLDSSIPRRADHAIALCEYSADILRGAGVKADRLSVIPPAIDDPGPARSCRAARLDLYRLQPVEPLSAQIADEDHVIGYCGNLDAYQNLELLLEGFKRVAAASSRSVKLLVATHTRDESLVKTILHSGIERSVRLVQMEDFVQARIAMEASDVLVLPRRAGSGYPIKLLNYLGLGRPVVTAGCGAKRIESGRDGLVVDDDDPESLAAALLRLATDSEASAELGAAGRRRFLADLTWEAVLPAVEHVYSVTTEAHVSV